MDEILNISEEAIIRYFDTLSKLGYLKYPDVYRMIVLFYLGELLDIGSPYFLTEEGLNIINKAVYCLSGKTCLIRFPEFFNEDSLLSKDTVVETSRISEDEILRYSEDTYMRLEESL